MCNNPVSGIIIWLAILWSSPLAGVSSILAVVTVCNLSSKIVLIEI
jgi:hypothetical protein